MKSMPIRVWAVGAVLVALAIALVWPRSEPLLYSAAKGGDLAAVRALLADGRDPDVTREVNVWDGPVIVERVLDTPLMAAIRSDHYDVASALLEAGASPDLGTDEGGFPLVAALFYPPDSLRYVELLLEYGASVDGCSYREVPIWRWAASRGGWRSFALIWGPAASCRADPDSIRRLHRSVVEGGSSYDRHVIGALVEDPDILLELGIHKAGVASPEAEGIRANRRRFAMSPLHKAVVLRDLERVQDQLAAGVDVNVATSQGFTPLMAAALVDWTEGVALLGDRGASATQTDSYGNSAMHFAAARGCDAVWNWFLANTEGQGPPDSTGRTPVELRKFLAEYRGE